MFPAAFASLRDPASQDHLRELDLPILRGRNCACHADPPRLHGPYRQWTRKHHFSHTWLDRAGAEGDLMELNGWTSPQMRRRYGASARGARARRNYDRVMDGIA
jgi:hypothetical protein